MDQCETPDVTAEVAGNRAQAAALAEVINQLRLVLNRLEDLAVAVKVSAAVKERTGDVREMGVTRLTDPEQEDVQEQIKQAIKAAQEQEPHKARATRRLGPYGSKAIGYGMMGTKEGITNVTVDEEET